MDAAAGDNCRTLAHVEKQRVRSNMDVTRALQAGSVSAAEVTAWISGDAQATNASSKASSELLQQRDAWPFVIYFLNLLRDESTAVFDAIAADALSKPNTTTSTKQQQHPSNRFDVSNVNDFPSLKPSNGNIKQAASSATAPGKTAQKRRIKPTQVAVVTSDGSGLSIDGASNASSSLSAKENINSAFASAACQTSSFWATAARPTANYSAGNNNSDKAAINTCATAKSQTSQAADAANRSLTESYDHTAHNEQNQQAAAKLADERGRLLADMATVYGHIVLQQVHQC